MSFGKSYIHLFEHCCLERMFPFCLAPILSQGQKRTSLFQPRLPLSILDSSESMSKKIPFSSYLLCPISWHNIYLFPEYLPCHQQCLPPSAEILPLTHSLVKSKYKKHVQSSQDRVETRVFLSSGICISFIHTKAISANFIQGKVQPSFQQCTIGKSLKFIHDLIMGEESLLSLLTSCF